MIKKAKVLLPMFIMLLCCLTSCNTSKLSVPAMDDFIKGWNETREKTGYINGAAYVEIKEADIQSSGDTQYFSVKTDDTTYVGAYNSASRSFALGYVCDTPVTTMQAKTAIQCLAPAICSMPKDTVTRLQEEFSVSKTTQNNEEEDSVNGFILLISENEKAEIEVSVKILSKGEDAVKTAVSIVEKDDDSHSSDKSSENDSTDSSTQTSESMASSSQESSEVSSVEPPSQPKQDPYARLWIYNSPDGATVKMNITSNGSSGVDGTFSMTMAGYSGELSYPFHVVPDYEGNFYLPMTFNTNPPVDMELWFYFQSESSMHCTLLSGSDGFEFNMN